MVKDANLQSKKGLKKKNLCHDIHMGVDMNVFVNKFKNIIM